VQPVEIVYRIDVRSSLQPDERAETVRVFERQCSTIRPPIEQPIADRRSSASASTMVM